MSTACFNSADKKYRLTQPFNLSTELGFEIIFIWGNEIRIKLTSFSYMATPWFAGKSSSRDLISVFHSQKNGQCSCDWVYQKNLCNWRGKKDTQHQTNFLASHSNHFHFLHQNDLNQIQWVNLHPLKIKEILMRRSNTHLNDHLPKEGSYKSFLKTNCKRGNFETFGMVWPSKDLARPNTQTF